MKLLQKLVVIGSVSCAALVGCNANPAETPAQSAPAQENAGEQGSDHKEMQGSEPRPDEEKPAEAPAN